MSELKFQQRKIQIAQKILDIRAENSSSDEEELAEIYEESHSDFTVSLEIYDWPNGSYAGIYSIFGFFLYEDEVEQFGPYISLKNARNHLHNISEADCSVLPDVSDDEHS